MKKSFIAMSMLFALLAFGVQAEEEKIIVAPETTEVSEQTAPVQHTTQVEIDDELKEDSMLGKCPCEKDDKKKDVESTLACRCKDGCSCGKKKSVIAKCSCKDKKKAVTFLACECPEEQEEEEKTA